MMPPRPMLLFRPESVTGSLGFYIPATALARALGLVRGIILARLIAEQEFGLFQVGLLAVNVLNPLCGLGLNEGVARYVPMYETRGRLRSYLRQAVPFVTLVALLLSAAVFLAAEPLGRAIFQTLPAAGQAAVATTTWTTLTRIVATVTFGTVLYFLLLAILKGLRMFRAVSLLELLMNGLFTLLTIVAALVGFDDAASMMGGYGLTLLLLLPLFAIPLSWVIADKPGTPAIETEGNAPPLRQLIQFSAWAVVAAVIWQVLQYYPMWFLQKTHGPAVTAVFGGVRLITQIVLVGAVTIIAVIQTSVNKLWESRGRAEADRQLLLAYKSTSMLMFAGCVLFSAFAGPIMRLFPTSFAIGVPIVSLSLLFFLISAHLTFLSVHFALIEKMRHLFWPWTLGLACNVLFGLWLVDPSVAPARALAGAAWAGNLAITAALLAAIALMRKENRPIDAGTCVFWVSMYALALSTATQIACLLIVLLVAVATRWIFTADEKQELIDHCRNLARPWLKG